jgi:RNA polymerase sigma factor (sigma-70 family)
MAATAAPVTTAEVAALHDRLTRFVYANFHRKLTFEEARDAAAEALGAADRAVAAGKEITDFNAWLCTAAWRDAISMVRRLEGEGRRKRLRPVDVSEQGEWLLDERDVEGEILSAHGRRAEREALTAMWARLKPDEQRALYLRYFDELPVDEVLQLLGCSRHHYENLTKRGIRKLREALVAGTADEACRDCRGTIVDSKLVELDPAQVVRRDAHLSSCLTCRAFQRR